jgi:thioredoxin-like negative regulator of GroEL
MNPSAERIQLLISLRKYAEAEAMAREQLAKDPESAEALAQLAQVLAASGPNRLNEALASVRHRHR